MLTKIVGFLVLIYLPFQGLTQTILQSPDTYLTHHYGKEFTPHHALVDYFQYIAENSDRVILKNYGLTNQKRPLIYAIISAPENLKRVEEIRNNNLKRTGLLKGKVADEDIAIVWLSFGVHGNEAGASESSLATLYDLANPRNLQTQKWLQNTIVILDPSVNPDGFSRYTHWNKNVGNAIPNPVVEAAEHHEPWPGGRLNHYLFDLNRDWAWLTQIESQQRIKVYHEWMPHIHVDFHEQYHNDPYYFAPAAQPYHAYISQWQGDFQHVIGKNNAKYFDQKGWLYFTREIFDLFYPSYGDTYPTFNGAIGMTYEQGGHSMAGRAILLENGDTLLLQDRIDHHHTTALSTVEVASENAKNLTDKFENYFKTSTQNPKGDYKSFIIKNDNQESKIAYLKNFLDQHGIQYGTLGTSVNLNNVFNYQTGKTENSNFSSKDLLISAHQPLSVLTQVLFEPEPFLVDSLTYDITAWALPYAFGLDAYASKEKLNVEAISQKEQFENYSLTGANAYAYLVDWNGLEDAQFLQALYDKNISARVSSSAFTLEGNDFSTGTLIINKGDNRKVGKDFDRLVLETANDFQQKVIPVKSGYATMGRDLGSDKMKLIKNPKILLLRGEETYQNAYGHLWHFFDQDMGIATTSIEPSQITPTLLGDYTVLMMPDGYYASLDSAGLEPIIDWVKNGGKLIAMGTGVKTLTRHPAFSIQLKKSEKDTGVTQKNIPYRPKHTHYAGQERRAITNSIPGAIYKVKIDPTHPLAYGLPDYYHSLKFSSDAYAFLEKAWNVAYVESQPDIKGFVGFNAQKKLKETLVFGVEPMGKGQVVYLVDNPVFRGFWRQGKFILANAVYLL